MTDKTDTAKPSEAPIRNQAPETAKKDPKNKGELPDESLDKATGGIIIIGGRTPGF